MFKPSVAEKESKIPKPSPYRHYKGLEYQVIDIVTHSETAEQMVLYRPLSGAQKLWGRPLSMFIETVEVDGEPILRSERVGEPPNSINNPSNG
jgi:hypothetical protein